MDDIAISIGKNRADINWKTRLVSWAELTARLSSPVRTEETVAEYQAMTKDERANIKDVGGFVGGNVQGRRKADNVQFRRLITLDADYATSTFWDDITSIFGGACCMYSTHSHTPEHPRLRLIMPLSRNVSTMEYEAVARKVAEELGILELLDDTTYEPNRLMYWPSASADGEFLFEKQDGPTLNPDEVLGAYSDWHDVSQWPRSGRVAEQLREKGQKAGDPLEKPGIIGAFCRVYTVEDALDTFLPEHFRKESDGRYSYIGGTTSCGVKIFDHGKFMFSWHDHDPYKMRLLNAFDAVRLHLFGKLDHGKEADDTPMSSRQSFLAMCEKLKTDKAVMDELIASQRDDNTDRDPSEYRFRQQAQDMDVAQMIADKYRGRLLFHESLGWLYWTGERWAQDAKNDAMRLQFAFYNELLQEALDNERMAMDKTEKAIAQAVLKKVQAMRNAGKIFSTEKLLREKLPLKDPDLLDPDPWTLNTPEGEVDLRTGEVHPHDPEHMCSHCTKVSPAPGPAPMWAKFLEDATCGDRGLRDYMQMVAGMAAVGQVYEEGMVIVYGPGGNGKSTMFGTLAAVLGDYACTIRSAVLVERGNAEPYGIDAARGRRMVLMGELDEGARLSISTVKSLTSRDQIQVNPKFKPTFTFQPTHKLILHTNHLPKLGQLDDGTRRRVSVVPFNAPMKTGKDRIPDLSERMVREEGPQILQWIITGARRFWESGCALGKPEAVRKATEDYIKGEDWLANFLDEKCVLGEKETTAGGALYAAYRQWCDDNKEYARRARDFAAELEKRGYTKKKIGSVWTWRGLTLQDELL